MAELALESSTPPCSGNPDSLEPQGGQLTQRRASLLTKGLQALAIVSHSRGQLVPMAASSFPLVRVTHSHPRGRSSFSWPEENKLFLLS